jgi:hypothetical protein
LIEHRSNRHSLPTLLHFLFSPSHIFYFSASPPLAHWQAPQANTKTKAYQRVCLLSTCGKPKRSSKLIKNDRKKEHQVVISCIEHLADSANINGVRSNKLCSGLTGLCFKLPNDTIHATDVLHARKP